MAQEKLPWEDKVKNYLPYCNNEQEAKDLAISMYMFGMDDVLYPLTIINDRYTGSYSGKKFTAWPLDFYQVPKEIDASDPECAHFWQNYKGIVGKGNSIMEAYNDLMKKMKEAWEETE